MFQYINIKNIVFLSTFIFIIGSTVPIIGTNNEVTAAELEIPKVDLIYNGGINDLSPVINVKDKIMTKLGEPEDEHEIEHKSLIYAINRGDRLSFDFENEPSQVDAFLIDYETDYTTLWSLEKTETGEFIANVPSPGLYNIEVHAIYPDGEYVSYSKLLNVIDNELDLLSLTPQSNECLNEVSLDKITAVGNPLNNLLGEVFNQPLVKALSFGIIEELNIQLNSVKNICGIQLGIKNSENNISFFAVQGSNDGTEFSDPTVFSNTGFSGELPEVYVYPSSLEAKFLKITPLGSTLERGLGITDFKLFGH